MFKEKPALGYTHNANNDDVVEVQNEIVFNSLFLAANNPNIVGRLSQEDQERLYEVLAAYTQIGLNDILTSNNHDTSILRRRIKQNKQTTLPD